MRDNSATFFIFEFTLVDEQDDPSHTTEDIPAIDTDID